MVPSCSSHRCGRSAPPSSASSVPTPTPLTLLRLTVLRSPCCRSFPYPGCQAQGCPEQLLFQFNETAGTAPHTITEQWFSLFGGGENDQPYEPNPDARIRVYLDGAAAPDLDFQLFFAHTIGVQSCVNYTQCPAGKTCSGVRTTCNDPRVPWHSSEVQHMAHAGALKNRYRIPFGTSIRITATMTHPGIIYCEPRHPTHTRCRRTHLSCPSS